MTWSFAYAYELYLLTVRHCLGTEGQTDTVTITTNTMSPYVVGDTVTLTCSASFANDSTMYSWSCSPSCFADGMTTQNITWEIHSEDDGINISCTVTPGMISNYTTLTVIGE